MNVVCFQFLRWKKKNIQLSEFLDVFEFQIGDDEEYESHDGESHVVLPKAPGCVLYSQVVQILLPCAPER